MISDIVRLILEEKDCSRKYYYYNLCFKWDNGIVVSAREDESYMVNKYDINNSIDHIAEAIERQYCIPLCYGFGFIYE